MNLDDLDIKPDGAAILDELHSALGKYVVFPSAAAHDATTLLIASTHAQPAWEHAPRGAFVSPEKRCGKSRLLDIVEATVRRALMTVNISAAAFVHSISADDPPTILIDEADTIFGSRKVAENNEAIRGIVNAGHQRNRCYTRYDITTRSNEEIPTFAIAILASIGDLPDTIMDRAIVVRMRRRMNGESVAPYRTRRDAPALHAIRDALSDWVRPQIDELAQAQPSMPVEDRAADTWEPLIAIADLAGVDWPSRARIACLALVAEASENDAEESLAIRLLADVRGVWEEEPALGFIPSRQLATRLKFIDDAPWLDRDLTVSKLSRMLRPYGIAPRHSADKTVRGYHRTDFKDAFARYLPSLDVQASTDPFEQQEGSDDPLAIDCPPDCPEQDTDVRQDDLGIAGRPGLTAVEDIREDGWTPCDDPSLEQGPPRDTDPCTSVRLTPAPMTDLEGA